MRIPDNGRAVHPAVRPSSIRHYPLDEQTVDRATCLVSAAQALSVGPSPLVVPGCTPRARRFFAARPTMLREGASSAALLSAFQGEYTAAVLFRMHSTPFVLASLLAYVGASGLNADDNAQFSLAVLANGHLRFQREHSVGVLVSHEFTEFEVQPYTWTLAGIRASNPTGLGPTGTSKVELLINGAVVGSSTLANSSGGAVAQFVIGALQDSEAFSAENVGNVDIAGVYVDNEAVPDFVIEQDVRRLTRVAFSTRNDLAVIVTDNEGAAHDLCSLEGVDFVDKVDVLDDVDNATRTATVTLVREQELLSLATLVTSTKPNLGDVFDPSSYVRALLLEGAPIEVLAARVPLGLRARPSEMQSLIAGVIDEVDEGGEAVALHLRDQGGRLLDGFAEQVARYGDDPPVLVEGEMQLILNDNDNDDANNVARTVPLTSRPGSYDPISLYVAKSPAWAVTEFEQRKEPVLAGLRTLAGQIAWECRYRYIADPFAPGWRLSFFEPERTRVAPDLVIGPDDIISVQRLSRSLLGMRNFVRIVYASTETTLPAFPPFALPSGITGRSIWWNVDGEGGRMVAAVELWSTRSIERYKRRQFMEMVEASTTQIDTVVEGTRMALGALLDLEEPDLDKSITLPLRWELEINDMPRFLANPLLFTGAQTLAVRSITHTFDAAETTTIALRGRPSLGFKRWLRIEARQGNGRPGVEDPREALSDQTAGTLLQPIRNFLDRTAYFKGGKFLAIRNSEFAAFSAGLENPPDGWEMLVGEWGVDAEEVGGDQSLTGGHAIRFNAVALGESAIVSDPIPISGDPTVPYSVEMKWKREQVDAGTYAVMNLIWLDRHKVQIGATSIAPVGPIPQWPNFGVVPSDADVWFQSRSDGITPPDDGTTPGIRGAARYVQIAVGIHEGGSGHTVVVDDVAMYRTAREWVTFTPSSYGLAADSGPGWINVRFNPVGSTPLRFDYGKNGFQNGAPSTVPATGEVLSATDTIGSGWYAREDMTVMVTATVAVQSATNPVTSGHTPPTNTSLRLVKNATYSAGDFVNATGEVVLQGGLSPFVPTADVGNANVPNVGVAGVFVAFAHLSGRVTLKRGDRLTVEFLAFGHERALADAAGTLCKLAIKQDLAQ